MDTMRVCGYLVKLKQWSGKITQDVVDFFEKFIASKLMPIPNARYAPCIYPQSCGKEILFKNGMYRFQHPIIDMVIVCTEL